jgi:magnesium-protoporphyrin IX monomethyl ester (oxidative) cyclase
MRVLLINVIPSRFEEFIPPIGLLYIASYLRSRGHQVWLYDSNELAFNVCKRSGIRTVISNLLIKEILRIIKKKQPDFVGLSISFSLRINLFVKIINAIRKNFKDIPIVVGGANVSAIPDFFANYADFVVVGEGEIVFDDILCAKIKGDHKIIFSDRINDLNSLSYPGIDMLNLNMYSENSLKLPVHGIQGLTKWFPVITSRGCPYDCIFCSIHSSMGYEWRARSPENVLGELDVLVNKYGIKNIIFEDDNISFSPERFYKICDQIIKRQYPVKWFIPNGIRFDALDKDLLSIMKNSGCQEIWIAPESGSKKTLETIIKKKVDLVKVKELIVLAKKTGIPVSCFFIIGFPGETMFDIQQTLSFIKELKSLGMYRYELSFAAPIPGTKLYSLCVEHNYLLNSKKTIRCSATTEAPIIKTEYFNPTTLKKLKDNFTGKQYSLGERLYILFRDNDVACVFLDLLAMFYKRLKKILR